MCAATWHAAHPEPHAALIAALVSLTVGGRHFVQIWVVLLSPAVLFFKSTTLATFVRLPVAFSAATIGTVTRTESPLAHVTLAPRLQTNSGFADAVVTQPAMQAAHAHSARLSATCLQLPACRLRACDKMRPRSSHDR